jgi:hypothetical protein
MVEVEWSRSAVSNGAEEDGKLLHRRQYQREQNTTKQAADL